MCKIESKAAKLFALCLVLFFGVRLFAGDLKVKSVVTIVNQIYDSPRSFQHEETIYVQGTRQRLEYRVPDTADAQQPHTAEITDCQTLSGYLVDLNTRRYAAMQLPVFPTETQVHETTRQQEKWSKKRYAIRIDDMRERKTVFGMTARHIVISMHGTTFEDRSEATIDGWYVDLPQPGCGPRYMRQGEATELRASFLTTDASKTVYTGFVPPGLAVQERITTISRFLKDGFYREMLTVLERKVVELSQEPLDARLFSVPEGFEKVERLPANLNVPRPALRKR